jgi:hypothetical protein
MSQLLVIRRTQMVEKEYLTQALGDLGHAWREGPARLGLFGPRVDIKVQVRGHNIGFRKAGQTYEMVVVGERGWSANRAQFLQQVSQRYAYHAARAKLEEQGFTLASEEVQQDGRIHLVLRRVA